jgi:CheY-like chemotaxis protein
MMDIVLKGEMDGIEAAQKIRDAYGIPVVYLTAYSDERTLKRAKITQPFGYIIKPFEDRELHSAVEVALYKHLMESKLKESEKWLSTTWKVLVMLLSLQIKMVNSNS